jgi:L-fuculose-phosphate aldolase
MKPGCFRLKVHRAERVEELFRLRRRPQGNYVGLQVTAARGPRVTFASWKREAQFDNPRPGSGRQNIEGPTHEPDVMAATIDPAGSFPNVRVRSRRRIDFVAHLGEPDGGRRMLLATERALIADYGPRMTADRLVVGTSGNLSIRSGDLLAVTPAGHAYDTLTPELVCVQRLDGAAVEGELAPSSELPIHRLLYVHTDAAAVVHTHSTAATVVSTVVDELPTIHYVLAVMGGPIRVAPYARFGSQELAANVLAAIEGRSGVLLANHGAVTYGPTIQVAYDRALYLEWVSEVWLRAHALTPAFTPRILGEADMAEVHARIQGAYGTTGRPGRLAPPGGRL